MSYSYATRKSYTRISPFHSKEDCWLFQGVYRLPHLYLTWIRRKLFTTASIVPPTHMLPLAAIVNAPHHRFGGSPLYTTSVTLCDTVAIHKYPCFVALTPSACVSAHWFRASTLSSYYSDRLSSRVPPRMELLYPSAPPREGVYLGAIKGALRSANRKSFPIGFQNICSPGSL